MEGIAAGSELTLSRGAGHRAGVRFGIATAAHDGAIRRLLRETPMAGEIRVSMEREPSYFNAGRIEGEGHRTIVAMEGDRVVAAGSVSERMRFVNGKAMRVGYLGGLRMDASCRGRGSIIRRGYELFRQLHERGGPALYLTSIVGDNVAARRLLERGVRGMPTYRFVGELVTLMIRRRRRGDFFKPTALVRRNLRRCGMRLKYGSAEDLGGIVELLNRDGRQYQFAPVWSTGNVLNAGLEVGDFRVVSTADGTAVACTALWDQRSVKQVVVRGYSRRLERWRPWINVWAALAGRPRLPAAGEAVSNAYVSHLACDVRRGEVAEWLIRLLHGPAHTRGIDYLTVGLDARDPRLAHLRKAFGAREYVTRIYAVHWEDGAELAGALDGRLVGPEVALL